MQKYIITLFSISFYFSVFSQIEYAGYVVNKKKNESYPTLKFSYKGRDFSILGDGSNFQYQSLIGDQISYDYKDRVNKIRVLVISYDYKERICKIGSLIISYDYTGKINKLGNANVNYDYQGRFIGTTGSID